MWTTCALLLMQPFTYVQPFTYLRATPCKAMYIQLSTASYKASVFNNHTT